MIRSLVDMFTDNSRRGSRRHSQRNRIGAPNIPGLVEVMEQRMLLSGTKTGTFGRVGAVHNLTLSQTNGPPGEPFTIGISESNEAQFDVEVLGPVGSPDTSSFSGMEVRIFLNPSDTPTINSMPTLTLTVVNATTTPGMGSAGEASRAKAQWDSTLANLASGSNTIFVMAFRFPSTFVPALSSFTIVNDRTRPSVQSLTGVPAGPVSTPVTSVTANFSENVTGLNSSAITLMRDGVVVDTSFTVIPSVAAAQQFQITGLNTSLDGDYELILNQSGVADLAGNTGTGTVSAMWTQDSQPPVFTDPPMLAPADDVGRDETGLVLPGILAGSEIKVTNLASVLDGFTVFGNVVDGDVNSINVDVFDVLDVNNTNSLLTRSLPATISGGSYSATINNADFTSPPFGPGFGTGTFKIVATAFDLANNQSTTGVLYLVVDNQVPAAPVVQLADDSAPIDGVLLTKAIHPKFNFLEVADNEFNAAITVERADGIAPAAVMNGDFAAVVPPLEPSINERIPSFTDDTTETQGTRIYRFKQTDLAENDPATVLTVVIDATAPVISDIAVQNADNSGLVPVTVSARPTLTFKVTDQTFAGLGTNTVTVELRDNLTGALLGTTTVNFTLGAGQIEGSKTISATIQPTMDLPIIDGQNNVFNVFLRAVDAAQNQNTDASAMQASSFTFFVSNPGDATDGAPGTPVYNNFFDVGGAVDETGVRLFSGRLQVWQTAFDKTTQTLWLTLEQGTGAIHFDPATGATEFYNFKEILGGLDKINNPHGVFFDFDTHANPRVWIAHRNAVGGGGQRLTGQEGRLSYIDLRTNEIVTYDINALLFPGVNISTIPDADRIKDLHAVFVDARGHVWVTSSERQKILEFDFDLEPDSAESPTIDSATARVTIHEVPDGLTFDNDLVTQNPNAAYNGHALKVVIDDQTGEAYAWVASVGGVPGQATGRVALLRPGAGESGEDIWTTWDLPRFDTNMDPLEDARVPFVEIDDNETPGDPADDRIVWVAPVTNIEGLGDANDTAGLVFVFDPGIIPNSTGAYTNGRLRAYRIGDLPGFQSNNGFAATNQPYIDREGGVYWIDRISGVGRIDLDGATTVFDTSSGGAIEMVGPLNQPITETFGVIDPSKPQNTPPGSVRRSVATLHTGIAPRNKQGVKADGSSSNGVDQYQVIGTGTGGTPGKGTGAFRGALNAGNVLYGALAQANEVSTTIFAETTRRQMAVVRTSDTLTQGAIVEGRMAFQVVRTKVDPTSQEQVGAVIMTFRNDGDILDKQVNLTSLVARDASRPNAIVRPQDIAMDGDVSAVRDALGNVYVVGKGGSKDLIAYRFTPDPMKPGQGIWSYMEFGDGSQILPAEPTALLLTDPATTMQRLVILATNSQGRLLKFDGAGPATDLTAVNVENSAMAAYGNLSVVRNSTGGGFSVYAVNQQGGVVQYILNPDLTRDSGPTLLTITSTKNGAGPDLFKPEEIRVFQSVTVVEFNGARHLLGNDGASRLVHMTQDMNGDWLAENVTKLTASAATGYFSFQQDYAARIYSEIAVVQDLGSMFVYGTNGGDLVEFRWDGANWKAANLTNDMTRGTQPTTRVTANNVFGAPDAYVAAPDGARHVMQINGEGEVVEYVLNRDGSFATQNINLARGNDVSDLREFSKAPIIRLPGGPALYAQNGMASTLDTNAVLVDNAASLDKQSIVIRVVDFSPGDVISFKEATGDMVLVDRVAVGTFTSSVDQSKVTVMLNETATRERVEMLLRQVQFSQRPVDPTKPLKLRSRLVDVTINDDQGKPLANAVKALAVLSVGALDSPIDGKILA